MGAHPVAVAGSAEASAPLVWHQNFKTPILAVAGSAEATAPLVWHQKIKTPLLATRRKKNKVL